MVGRRRMIGFLFYLYLSCLGFTGTCFLSIRFLGRGEALLPGLAIRRGARFVGDSLFFLRLSVVGRWTAARLLMFVSPPPTACSPVRLCHSRAVARMSVS